MRSQGDRVDAERRGERPRTRAAARPRLDAGIVLILIAGLLLLAQTALMVAANGTVTAPAAVPAGAAEEPSD